MKKNIYKKCPHCIEGIETVSSVVDGETVFNQITCRTCAGSGDKLSSLSLSDDFVDSINDILNKLVAIKQKVDEIKDKLDG